MLARLAAHIQQGQMVGTMGGGGGGIVIDDNCTVSRAWRGEFVNETLTRRLGHVTSTMLAEFENASDNEIDRATKEVCPNTAISVSS